jgi:hypothetical protein
MSPTDDLPSGAAPGKSRSKAARLGSVLWLVGANLLVLLALIEISLRVQQMIGPFIDLDIQPDVILVDLSDELNHVHPVGPDWDANGIRRMDEPNAPSCAPRILFMGDSFMEGLGPKDTIPYHVRSLLDRALQKDVCVFNAGSSSYSPSIYVAQAKRLVPLLRPDLVVVDIDETDVYDEWHRYRELVVRDDTGSVASVRRTPLADRVLHGYLESTSKPLYIHRLFAKLYFSHVTIPALRAQYFKGRPEDIALVPNMDEAEARRRLPDQIAYFAASLEDLTRTVTKLAGGPDRLVYIHHPHLQHLLPGPGRYNHIVAETIGEVAARNHVVYYDATADLAEQFGNAPQDYYGADDVHFNEAGLRAYSMEVAKFLLARLPSSPSTVRNGIQ